MPRGVYNRPTKIDIIGKRFGRLLVLSPDGTDSRHNHMYKCRCDCGAEKSIQRTNLVRNLTTSCGCKNSATSHLNTLWKGFGEISGSLWALIKKGAKERHIPMNLTIEEAWTQYQNQSGLCALTGEKLTFPKNCRDYDSNASLDRIDSSLPYEVGNVQWVVKDINLMKRNFDQDRFIKWCIKVAQNQKTDL